MNTLLKNKTTRVWMLVFGLLLFGFAKPQALFAQGYGYQQFYDELSPYGMWLHDPQYGYVWSPNVSGDFRPYYTNGYWVMTEYGNTWVSDYPWGWAAFHYGRWVYSNFYGWLWIPDSQWGPAWVVWRQGGGYYGWAPMGPGMSINISFGRYNFPYDYWTFIPYNYLHSRSFGRYYSPRRTRTIFNDTRFIEHTHRDNRSSSGYFTGPRRNEISQRSGRSVPVHRINDRNSAGKPRVSDNALQMYRPAVNDRSAGTAAPREIRQVDLQRDSRQKAAQNRAAGATRATPQREATPQRATTPQRQATPQREATPQRQATPQRATTPQRQATPQREATPQRQATPQRATTPQRQATPQREATPQRATTPQRQATPQRATTPQRQATPQRKAAPQREVQSRPAATPAKASPQRSSGGRQAERR